MKKPALLLGFVRAGWFLIRIPQRRSWMLGILHCILVEKRGAFRGPVDEIAHQTFLMKSFIGLDMVAT